MANVTFRAEVRDAVGNVSVLVGQGEVNAAPIIDAIVFAPAPPWTPGQEVVASIVASDPEGQPLEYALTADAGTFLPRQSGDATSIFRWKA